MLDFVVHANCWICVLEHAVMCNCPLGLWEPQAFVHEDVVHEIGLPAICMVSNEHLKMTWQKGEVLSNQEPQRRQGEAGTLTGYFQCGGMVAWAEEQLSLGVALGWLQEWLVEEHGKTSFPADGCRR